MERAGVATWTLCKVIFKSEQFKRDENGMKNKITIIQLSYKRYERHFTQQENKQSSQEDWTYSTMSTMDIFQGGSYTRPLIKH